MRNNRRVITPMWIGAAALLLAPAASSAGEGHDAAAAARGRTTYERYCTACHGRQGRGDGVLAEDLRSKPTDLTRLAAKNDGVFPYDAVVASIDGTKKTRGHGSADMPAWGDAFKRTDGTGAASPEQAIAEVAHFVWSLQKASDK